jgi:hypothetical protein
VQAYPFFSGKRFSGMVRTANPANRYDTEIISDLQPFLSTRANIINAIKIDKDREQRQSDLRLSNE